MRIVCVSVKVGASYWSAWCLLPSAIGAVCVPKPATGGIGLSEESGGHHTGAWSRSVCHGPCSRCCLLAVMSFSIFPKPGVCGLWVCIHAVVRTNWWVAGLGSNMDQSGTWWLDAGTPRGTCECHVPEEQVCEGCECAVKFKLDQPLCRWPVKWVGGLGSRLGCWADRGAVPGIWGICECCALVNPESTFYVCLHQWTLSLPARGKKRNMAVVSMFDVSSVGKCCCRQPVAGAELWMGHVSVLSAVRVWVCLPVWVCVSLWQVLSFATSWTCKRENKSCIPQPGQSDLGPEELEEASALLNLSLSLQYSVWTSPGVALCCSYASYHWLPGRRGASFLIPLLRKL